MSRKTLWIFFICLVGMAVIGGWYREIYEEASEKLFRKQERKIIFIIAPGRSGSSLTGEIFDDFDDEFLYLFEPVITVFKALSIPLGRAHIDSHHTKIIAEESKELLKDIISCNYRQRNNKYIALLNNFGKKMRFMQNLYEKKNCSLYKKGCKESINITSTIMNQVCQEYKNHHIVVKELYDRFPYEEPSSLDYLKFYAGNRKLYVMNCMRDPRAVFSSQRKLNWFYGPKYPIIQSRENFYITRGCANMGSVLQHFTKTQAKQAIVKEDASTIPYLNLRYEDLPHSAGRICKFLGLEHLERKFNEFLTEKTSSENDVKASMSLQPRDINNVINKWRKTLTYNLVKIIQYHCRYTMQTLGYKAVTSVEELLDFDVDLVETLPDDNFP